jgi:hypothetical protein
MRLVGVVGVVAVAAAGLAGCGDDLLVAKIAKSAVVAEARVASGQPLGTVLASEPLSSHYRATLQRDAPYLRELYRNLGHSRQRLQFVSADVNEDGARATASFDAYLSLREPSGQSGGISRERYVVDLRRISGRWIVTRLCNPNEASPC